MNEGARAGDGPGSSPPQLPVPGPARTAGIRGLATNRLEAFSDGVFAIAITLLALEITVPIGAESDLLGALIALWPAYLAYLISFLTIGWVWVGHAAITAHMARADALFVRLNLLLLLGVAFLPFPTRLMAEYLGEREPERIAVVLYGTVLLTIALLLAALWRHALRTSEIGRGDLSDEELARLRGRSTPSVILYLLSMAVGFVLPTLGVFCFLLVSIYLVIPLGSLVRDLRRLR